MRRLITSFALVALLVTGSSSIGQGVSRTDDWYEKNLTELTALYTHLHKNPELSFREGQTAKRVAEELRKSGVEVTTGVGKLGVVGVLKNGNGPTTLVRSDMDALPVKEQTGLPYASQATV